MNNALYIIATPIGNLGDITLRAIEALKNVEYIFCEDCRVSSKLIKHLSIEKKLISCNAHTEKHKINNILKFLTEGKSVAYISDAGTPGLSDPGNLIVNKIAEQGFKIIPIPGVSSLSCLISVCGFNLSSGFFFCGFFPRKQGKFKKLIETNEILFGFESPYRIKKTLEFLAENCPEAEICLGRELTKLYEEVLRAKAKDFVNMQIKEKGEFVLGICK